MIYGTGLDTDETERDESRDEARREDRTRTFERIVTRAIERDAESGAAESVDLEPGVPRQFVDQNGTVWRVSERTINRAMPQLVFESDLGWRKIGDFPLDWRRLSRMDLDRLSRSR